MSVQDLKPATSTPGPWEPNTYGTVLYTRDHQPIADCYGDKANARLIAQAPAMLELLLDLQETCQQLLLSEDFHRVSGGDVSHRVNVILAAIDGEPAVQR